MVPCQELYERLLDRTNRANTEKENNLKVWVTYSQFEVQAGETEAEDVDGKDGEEIKSASVERARKILERAYAEFKTKGMKEARVAILEVHKALEQNYGDSTSLAKIEGMSPNTTKRTRKNDLGQIEEYWDIVFPDDEADPSNVGMKFMRLAHAWKKKKLEGGEAAPVLPQITAGMEVEVA